ncbi:hypothetical protein F5B22DRAFT_661270 [Xylaria bambusicola]|uniref:uncharacterized protein n=1 Tax=Xylaria bambusicola TaxID=326684 RepID=UPI0020074845|nr:uncharacterized protein F5B22DRAFT_661270 [Xylaria bambusicola]KAI0521882.1 hypothetical protein F5B22DRAFT_661270 [Xylaria bambusicola]
MDNTTDSTSDMAIHGLAAIAGYTPGPSILEEPSPSENRALRRRSRRRREPSPVSSSSSSSDDPDLEERAFSLYLRRKGEDLESAISAAEQCRLACWNARDFAYRVEMDVLESPVNNIPTAYAVERLDRLTLEAISQATQADKIYDNLGRIYIYPSALHVRASKQLEMEAVQVEFWENLAEWKNINAATQTVLRRAYQARAGLPPQWELGEAPPQKDDDGGGVEGGNKGIVEDDGSEQSLSPPSKIPMKRTFMEEPTSSSDEDGNEVSTMDVTPDLWTVRKRKRPKLEEKQEGSAEEFGE